MSYKKKEAQAARRIARLKMKGYGEEWGEKLKVFNEALKPRPKWIPKKLWRKLSRIFVDVEKIENMMKSKE